MSDMKCPFCQQELVKDTPFAWDCPNEECVETDMMWGTANMWQELIRTRKALDVAVNALKDMNEIIKNYEYGNGVYYALDGHDTMLIAEDVEKALNKITTLEQKE